MESEKACDGRTGVLKPECGKDLDERAAPATRRWVAMQMKRGESEFLVRSISYAITLSII